MSGLLFYGGLALAGFSLVLGIIMMVIFAINGKNLGQKLDEEYGKRVRFRMLRR